MNTVDILKAATNELKADNDAAELKEFLRIEAKIKARKEAAINPIDWQYGLNDEYSAQNQLESMMNF
jgi:hypothetical protein